MSAKYLHWENNCFVSTAGATFSPLTLKNAVEQRFEKYSFYYQKHPTTNEKGDLFASLQKNAWSKVLFV